MKRTNIYVLIVAMLLLCIALGMGAIEEKEYTEVFEFERLGLIENRTWQEEQRWNELKFEMLYPNEKTPTSTAELKTEVTRVYGSDTGYTRVVYTIENVGDIPVTRLQVSVYLKDDMNKITAVETCYPSDYPDYGLKPGQIMYAERLFNEDQSIGSVSGGVKIVNYDTGE